MQSAPRPRLAGLDLFRGLAVAGMIIVNTPGSGDYVWWPLEHAAWHGFTPTDLVFPAFLFAVGTALALSFPRRIDAASWARIARRALLLIAIGWAWQMLARPGIEHFRVFGVLPRIGLCYALVAALAILTARRDSEGQSHLRPLVLFAAATAILIAYAAAMALGGDYTPEGNLAGRVDRMLVGANHMWRFGTDAAGNVVYDPEGLFSTIPALANVLFGMLAAILWQRAPRRAVLAISVAGIVLVTIGVLLDPIIPINKRLWTSSYALFSSGLAALVLALCMTLPAQARALAPLNLLGMNAILAYVGSLLIGLAGMRFGFQPMIFAIIQSLVGDPFLASFLYALAILSLVVALLLPLHRRGIHLRL